jgi:ABC-2 type transport system permease protein
VRAAIAIAVREIRAQVTSPLAWTVAAGFLLLAGSFFVDAVLRFVELTERTTLQAQMLGDPRILERLNLNEIVALATYRRMLVLLLFLVPLVAMRSFAEERSTGTEDLLKTAPIGPGAVALGKLIGVAALPVAVVAASSAASSAYPIALGRIGDPETGPLWTGLLGLLLAAIALTAVGVAVSAWSDSQVVAGVVALVAGMLLFVADWPAQAVGGRLGELLVGLSLAARYEGFGAGWVSLADAVYFLSIAAAGWFVARTAFETRRAGAR